MCIYNSHIFDRSLPLFPSFLLLEGLLLSLILFPYFSFIPSTFSWFSYSSFPFLPLYSPLSHTTPLFSTSPLYSISLHLLIPHYPFPFIPQHPLLYPRHPPYPTSPPFISFLSIPLSHITPPLYSPSPLLLYPTSLPFIPPHIFIASLSIPLFQITPSPLFHSLHPFTPCHPALYSTSPSSISFLFPTSLSPSAPARASQLTNKISNKKKTHTVSHEYAAVTIRCLLMIKCQRSFNNHKSSSSAVVTHCVINF